VIKYYHSIKRYSEASIKEDLQMDQNKEKVKITAPERILTLANMISMGRALLAIPIIYTLRDPSLATVTFLLIILAVLSDAADGYFARRAHEVTHLGKWLDPIADFIVILAVISYLVLMGRFPVWFFSLFIIRYVSIAIPAIYLLNHTHFFLSANWWGKWAIGISALAVIFHLYPVGTLGWLPSITLLIATVLMVLSWVSYMITLIRKIREI